MIDGGGDQRRIVVAITGASGAVYGIRALEMLADVDEVETHLVISTSGRVTIGLETDRPVAEVEALADLVYGPRDISAAISSGSFPTAGMIVAPCSIKTLSAVANSYSADLVARAADVTLKQRRPLVLMVRETPLHRGHLRLMSQATEAGAIVYPPVPAFYNQPAGIDDIIDHTVGRALEMLHVEVRSVKRWHGPNPDQQR
ncbi:MAG: UbiX family flavin prenyltransferase [Acidimicrobiia bacterium]|nr:UbiX family flavin prenyltransferase [Acidimicrobiia bacterium]